MCATLYNEVATAFKRRTSEGRKVHFEHSVDLLECGTSIQNGFIQICGSRASKYLGRPTISGEGMTFAVSITGSSVVLQWHRSKRVTAAGKGCHVETVNKGFNNQIA